MLVVVEGIDGTGKSTLVNNLVNTLTFYNKSVLALREPGGTKIGENIRKLIINNDNELDKESKLMLFFAARLQLINEKIKKSEHDFVILDRYYYSSIAYQCFGEQSFSLKAIKNLINIFKLPKPDIGILLFGNVNEMSKRIINKNSLDKYSLDFYSRVQKGYLQICKEDKDTKWIQINASNSQEEILKESLVHILKG